jgi:hypothetical protein
MFGSKVSVRMSVQLLKLPELLFQRHPREQGINPFLYVGLGSPDGGAGLPGGPGLRRDAGA